MKNLTVNKAELISKIKTLEGLTNEEKADLIGLLRQHKKYGLVWEDKVEDVEERLRDELPILREVKDKAIIAGVVQSDFKSDCSEYKDFQSDKRITNADTHGERIANPLEQAPNHILIEGDNLEALTALSYTHEGKIDVIYIDPPYNTGHKDFTYNDNYVDRDDGFRHSKWLSFMSKRLKIAKSLLKEKGMIFISIDDNEDAQLKLLCDEIFLNRNKVSDIIWQSRKSVSNDTFVSMNHNYTLVYAKDLSLWDKSEFRLPTKTESFENRDNDPRGPWVADPFDAPNIRPNLTYGIVNPNTGEEFWPPKGRCWRTTEEQYKEFLADNRIVFGKKGTSKPQLKRFQDFAMAKGDTPTSIWNDIETTTNGTQLLQNIFGGEKVFSNPKPVELVKRIMILIGNKNLTILDFFAGSGTTLHATMQLNAEDGGHRKCILVTNNENNICKDVTYERNKRVINGYTTPKGVEVAGLKANTLRYYKTDYISRDRTQKNMRALVAAATDMLCIKEDLYEEQKMFGRVKVNPRVMCYFSDGRKHMLVVYREEVVDMLVEEIKSLPLTGKSGFPKLKIYIFSPGRYAFDDNFYEVRDKVQLVALPAAIYDAYMKVLPKRREQMIDEEKKEETQMPQDLFEEAEKGGEV